MAKHKQQADLTQEIASARTDPKWWGAYLGLLENPDKVLRLEAQGDLEVYDDLGRDPHVASVLRTRALAVIGKEWEVVPGGDDARAAEIAEYVKQVFLGFPFDASRRALLRGGILKGFAVGEVLWDVSEGQYAVRGIAPRPQRRFKFDLDGGLRMLTRADPFAGELVCEAGGASGPHPRKFQVFTFGDEPETPYGVGLGRELYWPVWFKKAGIKGWVVFCERFGQPTPWGKYPAGASKADQDTLFDALKALQEDNAVMTPEGMSIDLLEAARTSSIDSYDSLCSFMNDEVSKSVLGQTATVSGTPGKLGSEDAQENVRLDLVAADADAQCESLNGGVVRWVVDLNYGPQKVYPKLWVKTEPPEDLALAAERDAKIYAMGFEPTEEYVQDTYGAGWVKRKPAANPFAGLAFAEAEPKDPAAAAAEAALKAAGENDLVRQVYALLGQAGSFAELQGRLKSVELDLGPTARALADARLVAQLAGRYQVSRGA